MKDQHLVVLLGPQVVNVPVIDGVDLARRQGLLLVGGDKVNRPPQAEDELQILGVIVGQSPVDPAEGGLAGDALPVGNGYVQYFHRVFLAFLIP